MKKFFQIILLLLIIGFCFKGTIFRSLIKYNLIFERNTENLQSQELIKLIDSEILKINNLKINDIIEISSKLTNRHLSFTFQNIPQNLTSIISSKKGNCVGYARLFNSIFNYIISKKGLNEKLNSKHLVANIYFLGIDLRNILTNPFFSDHDFISIIDIENNKTIYFDPSLNDYSGIREVELKKL